MNWARTYLSFGSTLSYSSNCDALWDSGAGSDYMSFTQLNYPSAFASEGNPLAGGRMPGNFDPYVHGVNDTMDVDDETGYFSIDVSGFPVLVVLITHICGTAHGSLQRVGDRLCRGTGWLG